MNPPCGLFRHRTPRRAQQRLSEDRKWDEGPEQGAGTRGLEAPAAQEAHSAAQWDAYVRVTWSQNANGGRFMKVVGRRLVEAALLQWRRDSLVLIPARSPAR